MSITSTASERVGTSQDDSSPQHLINVTKHFPDLQSLNFTWNSYSGELFCRKINTTYEKVVHWRRNLFQVPSGKMKNHLSPSLPVYIKLTLTVQV